MSRSRLRAGATTTIVGGLAFALLAGCGSAPTMTPLGATTECGASAYPCDWADVPSDVIEETVRLNGEARTRIGGGASYTEVADWLRTQPGVATVEADGDALRFRPVGGRPMWIISAASFRGPTVSQATGFQLASFRVPNAVPASAADIVGGDVESKNALVLSPYLWNFDPFDSGPPAAGVLDATRGYEGQVTQLANAKKADQTVGLDEFEHWDEYDVIFVSSHGARICFADTCRAAIAAGQLPANEPLLSHQQIQRLRASGIELLTDSTGSTAMLLGADFFRIHYPSGLEDTLVIIDACETLGPLVSDIADALRGTTSEYIGWTETVNSDVSTAASVALLQKLSEGVTVKHAYESLGSLKNDPDTGAQLTLAGRPAGDLRIREIVSFRDATGASQLTQGAEIDITGTPGDGTPDRVPWHVVVEGLDPDEAGATPLHVTIEGTTADPVFVDSGQELKPGVWLVDGEVALTSDLAKGQQLSMRASVDLVDMGTSTTELTATVAEVKARRYECAKLITATEIAAAWVPVEFIRQQFGTDTHGPPESTSCSFATKVGPPPYMEVAVNVNTGQAVALYRQAIFSAPGAVALPGIGDQAAFVQSGNTAAAGAMVRDVLIIVQFRNVTAEGGAPVPNARAAAERLLKLVAGRV